MPVIVALDYPELRPCRELIQKLKGLIKIYKIGTELFTAQGWEAVELVQKSGAEVFLDLKLHDIPATVARTSRVIAERGVWMFNVHASGGFEMMRQTKVAVDEKRGRGAKPLVMAVTILTSLEEKVLKEELSIRHSLRDQVMALAHLAKKAGLDGVICSPEETESLRREFGKNFMLVTPGIRPVGSDSNDQKRSLTPKEALQKGANYLVIGRPITAAPDPCQAARQILHSLE